MGSKVDRPDEAALMGVGVASPAVELDDIVECWNAAVMHVGRRATKIAQGGGTEGAEILTSLGDAVAALIGKLPRSLVADASVVELKIGKLEWSAVIKGSLDCVAPTTPGAPLEQLVTVAFDWAESPSVTAKVSFKSAL